MVKVDYIIKYVNLTQSSGGFLPATLMDPLVFKDEVYNLELNGLYYQSLQMMTDVFRIFKHQLQLSLILQRAVATSRQGVVVCFNPRRRAVGGGVVIVTPRF